jgi:DNA modification methylase
VTAAVIHGDARHLPLPDASVDLIVTSPPYFGLRDYGYAGQIGSEATPGEWLEALWECTAEWVRVLKPEGSLFVNLGDKYAGVGGSNGHGWCIESESTRERRAAVRVPLHKGRRSIAPPKSLMGLPWRYAIGCMDRLGLILRAEIIWEKVNGLPESVGDRVRRGHEQLFHFVKQPRYYSGIDAIRLPADTPRRALRAPRGPVAQSQEVTATVRAGDGVFTVQGICDLGSLAGPIEAPVTGDAQSLQVVRLVGFSLRVEVGERAYVADLQPSGLGAALDAPMPVAVKDALAQFLPPGATPSAIPATPSGVLLAGSVVPDTWRRAKVTRLDCVLCPPEGLAARVALDLNPGEATLLVWRSFGTAHESSLPNGNTSLGKLPSSVWHVDDDYPTIWPIPSQPLIVPESLGISHFAAFPPALVRPIVLGWSPPGVCTACGQGRRPVARRELTVNRRGRQVNVLDRPERGIDTQTLGWERVATITGYACACPEPDAPTRPSVVLDPFGGTGTTALVASAYGRHGITVDLSAAYCRLAAWRVNDPGERARARAIPKPPPVPDGQASLFP